MIAFTLMKYLQAEQVNTFCVHLVGKIKPGIFRTIYKCFRTNYYLMHPPSTPHSPHPPTVNFLEGFKINICNRITFQSTKVDFLFVTFPFLLNTSKSYSLYMPLEINYGSYRFCHWAMGKNDLQDYHDWKKEHLLAK